MKKYKYLFFAALLTLLCACGKTDENSISDNEIAVDQETGTEDAVTDSISGGNASSKDAAADGSAGAKADVSGNAADGSSEGDAVAGNTNSGSSSEEDSNKTIVNVQRINNNSSQAVSSAPSEYDFDDDDDDDFDDDESTGLGTPNTFDVDDAMIAVDGTYNTKLSGELLTAINNARENAGIDAFEANASLNKVADVRAKEITYSLGHLRADGSYWSTVAPLYYEAECIAQGFTTASDTVNAWLSDSNTRQYLLSEDLYSIGLSCFEYAGSNYIVASFGD